MHPWGVILLSVVAVLLLVVGLVALIMPDPYEGRAILEFDEQHTVRALDVIGFGLLAMGCDLAWIAGRVWQRRMYGA